MIKGCMKKSTKENFKCMLIPVGVLIFFILLKQYDNTHNGVIRAHIEQNSCVNE